MVRTGARAEILRRLLVEGGLRPTKNQPSLARIEALPPNIASQLLGLYRALGGQAQSPRFRPGQWDLAFEGDLVVELDEELHFNRYRAQTLTQDWERTLPWGADYVGHCRDREGDCIAAGCWGKRWTNPSCEKLFGVADPPCVFASGGAPRWKQRAFYDAIKDAFSLSGAGVHVARVAVHDVCEGVEIGAALQGRRKIESAALVALVKDRSAPT